MGVTQQFEKKLINILMPFLFILVSRINVVALLHSERFTVVKKAKATPRCTGKICL